MGCGSCHFVGSGNSWNPGKRSSFGEEAEVVEAVKIQGQTVALMKAGDMGDTGKMGREMVPWIHSYRDASGELEMGHATHSCASEGMVLVK